MDRRYFGMRIKAGRNNPQFEYCFQNNRVVLGWSDINFSEELCGKSEAEIRAKVDTIDYYVNSSERSKSQNAGMFYRLTTVGMGDVIIVPGYQIFAVGEVVSDHIQFDASQKSVDMANYFPVKWIHKAYAKNKVCSNFNSSLKFRQTIVSFDCYQDEIEKLLIDTSNNTKEEVYNLESEIRAKDDISRIYQHIENRNNIYFSDDDFERFVLDVFQVAFGMQGTINPKLYEVNDGKDIAMTGKYGLDSIAWNIQVKQHEKNTDRWAIEQIQKSGKKRNEVNIVVSNSRFSADAEQYASQEDVVLVDGQALAEIIYDNFDGIDERWKAKLNLFRRVHE